MKKYLLTLAAVVVLTPAFAASDNANNENKPNSNMMEKSMGLFKGWNRSMTADVVDQGKTFQINLKTKADMPVGGALEIGAINVIAPTGRIIPGVISLTLRPAGDVQAQVVGPQQGSFTFAKGGDLPQALPYGRYLLTVNGEVYGMLVAGPNKTMLRQGLKPQGGGEEATEEPAENPTTTPAVPQPATAPTTMQPLTTPQPVNPQPAAVNP